MHRQELLDHDIPRLAETGVSFTMVRHPFERLVSAYQSKYERNLNKSTRVEQVSRA